MTKYVFKKYKDPDNRFDNTDVEIVCETETRDELLESFLDFLAGCGFYVNDWRNEFLYGECSCEKDKI